MSTTRKRNYYELLGVPRAASVDEIKEAYRDIARLYHPDSNFYDEIIEAGPDESGIFKDITAAYTVLISEQKRREYDRNLAPELADWDSGDAADDVKQVHRDAMTAREVKAKETAERVKRDLVGKGKVVTNDTPRTASFGARFEEEPDEPEPPPVIAFFSNLIRETLGGNPTIGQTLFVVFGLTLFGVGIVFILLSLLNR